MSPRARAPHRRIPPLSPERLGVPSHVRCACVSCLARRVHVLVLDRLRDQGASAALVFVASRLEWLCSACATRGAWPRVLLVAARSLVIGACSVALRSRRARDPEPHPRGEL